MMRTRITPAATPGINALCTLLAGLALLAPLPSQAQAPAPSRPVTVGLDGPGFNACGAVGEVRGLREDGDNRLTVHATPASAGVEIDRLRNGAPVILCDSSKDGKWSGIVYPGPGQKVADCGTSTPQAKQTAYAGPCRSGWVASTFVVVTAG